MEMTDKKVLAELEALYANEDWSERERQNHIRFAYNSIMKQREAQAKYGTVDANDPEAVRAAVERRKAEKAAANSVSKPVAGTSGGSGTSGTGGVSLGGSAVNTGYAAAEKRVEQAVDAATKAAVSEVQEAKAQADAEYQEQRDAIAVQAAQDKDNSALYSELRGDRGGIGKAQYDSIQNTAARNQAAVNRAQTETARAAAAEIIRLQAKGEYEKAEKLLELTQDRLAALLKLQQLDSDERAMQDEVQRWQAEYELSAAKLTGVTASGGLTADASARLAALGEAMLKKGLMPSAAQLKAMGMTAAQAREYIGRA